MSSTTHLIGRTTRIPELKFMPSGKAVTNFSLAVDRDIKREGYPEVDFYRVTVWGKQAENVAKYCERGHLVDVTGPLYLNPYTRKDLVEVIAAEVTAEHVKFLSRPGERKEAPEEKKVTTEDFADDGLPF